MMGRGEGLSLTFERQGLLKPFVFRGIFVDGMGKMVPHRDEGERDKP